MRRTIGTATTPGRWRRLRTLRIALATALIVAAPFVGGRDPGGTGPRAGADSSSGGTSLTGTSLAETASVPGGRPGAESGAAPPGSHTGEPLRVVPVPLADPGVADVLSPGDLVDLVAVDTSHADPDRPGPVLVAHGARVRDTPDGRPGTRSILVEVPESAAASLAATAAGTPLAVIVHG